MSLDRKNHVKQQTWHSSTHPHPQRSHKAEKETAVDSTYYSWKTPSRYPPVSRYFDLFLWVVGNASY